MVAGLKVDRVYDQGLKIIAPWNRMFIYKNQPYVRLIVGCNLDDVCISLDRERINRSFKEAIQLGRELAAPRRELVKEIIKGNRTALAQGITMKAPPRTSSSSTTKVLVFAKLFATSWFRSNGIRH